MRALYPYVGENCANRQQSVVSPAQLNRRRETFPCGSVSVSDATTKADNRTDATSADTHRSSHDAFPATQSTQASSLPTSPASRAIEERRASSPQDTTQSTDGLPQPPCCRTERRAVRTQGREQPPHALASTTASLPKATALPPRSEERLRPSAQSHRREGQGVASCVSTVACDHAPPCTRGAGARALPAPSHGGASACGRGTQRSDGTQEA